MADLYAQAAAFRAELLDRDAGALRAIRNAYGVSYRRIQSDLGALLEEIEAEQARGKRVSAAWLRRQDRLEALLRGVDEELAHFAERADGIVTAAQEQAVTLGTVHAEGLTRIAWGEHAAAGSVQFNRVPKEAVRDLVGFLSNGSPVREILDELGPDSSRKVQEALIHGVTAGKAPRAIAREIRDELGGNLVRAQRIARTETLRSYRSANLRTLAANREYVPEYRWTATRTTRTCAMCLAMDGRRFPVTVPFGSHCNCRCIPVPVPRSLAEIVGDPSIPDIRSKRDTGPEWFARQPASAQRQILGPGKHALYEKGKLRLEDLVGHREDPKWGPVRWERPLKDFAA